jgi:hypothetical protein
MCLTGNFNDSGFYRLKNLQVAGAAAKIAGERFADLVARGVRICIEQSFGGNENRGSAVAALRRAKVSEGFLQRVQRAIRAEAFNGDYFSSVALDSQEQAGEDRFAVEEDSAGAAFAQFAAMLRAGVVEIFAEDFEQGFIGSEGHVRLLTI